MATVAAGRACPADGTLVTCVGQATDAALVGTCPFCGAQVSIANLNEFIPATASEADHAAALAAAVEPVPEPAAPEPPPAPVAEFPAPTSAE